MCRLYGFRCSDPTKVECTLVHAQNALMIQSRADRRGISHTDGWGISYYRDHTPLLERRATAAFEDLHFASTVEKVYARTVVAHVRKATVGEISLENTHPFCYHNWTFAHNGTVSAFSQLEPRLLEECLPGLRAHRRGSTDSELSFLWLLSRLSQRGLDIDASFIDPRTLLEEFGRSVSWLAEQCLQLRPDAIPRLNFLLTNGDALVACRLSRSLYWVERNGIHDCEICGIPHISSGRSGYRAVVVASEPISDEPWQEIPESHAILVTRDLAVSIAPLETSMKPLLSR